jgi:hypothetical protein
MLMLVLVIVIESENQRSRSQRSQGKVGSVLFFCTSARGKSLAVISYLLSGTRIVNRIPVNLTLDDASRRFASSGFARNPLEHFLKE